MLDNNIFIYTVDIKSNVSIFIPVNNSFYYGIDLLIRNSKLISFILSLKRPNIVSNEDVVAKENMN